MQKNGTLWDQNSSLLPAYTRKTMTYRQTCTGTEEKTRGRQQQGPIFRYSKLPDADPLSDRIELEEQARTALPAEPVDALLEVLEHELELLVHV